MPISKEDLERLEELAGTINESMREIESIVRSADESLFERWKAYGKQVTDEFISMGPCLSEVIEELSNDIEEDDDDEEEEENV